MARPAHTKDWALCGCWNSVNSQPDVDLRDGLHGWREHDHHEDGETSHAWCDVCSPDNPSARRKGGGPSALRPSVPASH